MFDRFRFWKQESGQTMILFAAAFIMLCGFTAMTVDVGMTAHTKSKLQKVADAAALAGAQEMPSTINATSAAIQYAGYNGVAGLTAADVAFPSTKAVRVTCSETVPFSFGKALGFNDRVVTATAVAENTSAWEGQTLPFVNVDDNYSVSPNFITAWDKTGNGYFEIVHPDSVEPIGDKTEDVYFVVDWQDGIMIKPGVVSNGTDNVLTNLELMYAKMKDSTIYVFSLRSDIINNTLNPKLPVQVMDKKGNVVTHYMNGKPTLANSDTILPSQLVLLECTWDLLQGTGQNTTIGVTYTREWDVFDNAGDGDPDIPTGFHVSGRNSSRLIE